MAKIRKIMGVPELDIQPPITQQIRLSDDMQQTLALLTGYSDNHRVVLKASESGMLNTVSPQIKEVVVVTANDDAYDWQGGDIPCTEVAVMGDLDNSHRVWVRPNSAASSANGWPLDKGEPFGFTLSNLNQLHINIETNGEKAIVAYTR